MERTTTTRTSRYAYGETVDRLTKAIVASGNTVFASIDQAAAAREVGLTLQPTTLLVFGNPKGGTPLMAAFPLVALELPLKLVVWEQDGAVHVAAMHMASVAERYGVTGFDAQIATMDHALASLIGSVAAD